MGVGIGQLQKNWSRAARVVAPGPVAWYAWDKAGLLILRTASMQDAGLMAPCGGAERSLGLGGRGLSQMGDDLKWSMSPSTNHHQRTETGQGKGQEVWSKAWQASTVDQSQRVSKMVAKIE